MQTQTQTQTQTLEEFLASGEPATNAEITRRFGVSERTIRRRRKHLREKGVLRQARAGTDKNAPKLTVSGSTEAVNFQGLITGNPLDPTSTDGGAFAKIFELAGLTQEDYELVQDTFKFSIWEQSASKPDGTRDLIPLYSYSGTFRKKNTSILTLADVTKHLTPRKRTVSLLPSAKDPTDTFVISLADLQIGKVGSGGGTPELMDRLASVLGQVESHLQANPYQYAEIVLADAGDITEGFHNVAAQAQTNDLSMTDQLRLAQRIVVEALKRFVPYAPKFTYAAVPSNHCRVRTTVGNKNSANAPDDDYGLLIFDNTRLALSDVPGYDHIAFVKPSKWEEAVTHTTADGTVLGLVHGHQFGQSIKARDWLSGMVLGERSDLHKTHVLLFGHHHHFSLELAGHGQHLVGSPSLDNNSDWFSNVSGTSSPSSLLTFELSNKRSKNWRIWYP